MSGDENYFPSRARMEFHRAALEVIYQCHNESPSLRDLQNMRADANAALEAVSRKIGTTYRTDPAACICRLPPPLEDLACPVHGVDAAGAA